MFWTIVRREFLDHVMNFRFSAIFILILVLMTVCVGVFSAGYKNAAREHPRTISNLVNDDGKTALSMAPCQSGEVRRAPSAMAFCSGMSDRELPNVILMHINAMEGLGRIQANDELLSGSKFLDWTFVVTVILSFAAGLLTYKGISGERSDGTLTLVLSNPLPRSTLLLAKYSAVMIALAITLFSAVTFSLITLRSAGAVDLTNDDYLKVALFGITSLLYVSVFVLLGLICSVFARSPLIAAVAFLFNWLILVFVIPNLGGIIAGLAGKIDTPVQVQAKADAIDSKFPTRPGMTLAEEASVRMQRKGASEELLLEHVQALLNQADLGRYLTRVSPASTFRYAAENITGGGTFRFMSFIRNAIRYREGFFAAMLEADRKDPKSQHIYCPNRCGGEGFTKETVDLGPAKEFRDPPPSSGESAGAALTDIAILIFFNLIAFAVAFWPFTRMDVAPTPGV